MCVVSQRSPAANLLAYDENMAPSGSVSTPARIGIAILEIPSHVLVRSAYLSTVRMAVER